MRKRIILGCGIIVFMLSSCADRTDYYKAHQEREQTRQLKNEQAERQRAYEREQLEIKRMAHRERMTVLSSQALAAAAKTTNTIDDILVPYHLASLEDKWAIADLLASSRESSPEQIKYDTIEAPEKPSEYVKLGVNLLLGGGAIAMGINSQNALVDLGTAGINAAGVHLSGEGNTMTNDSFKSGTDNVITGDSNSLSSGDVSSCATCDEETLPTSCVSSPSYFIDEESGNGYASAGCSCDSYLAGHCI